MTLAVAILTDVASRVGRSQSWTNDQLFGRTLQLGWPSQVRWVTCGTAVCAATDDGMVRQLGPKKESGSQCVP